MYYCSADSKFVAPSIARTLRFRSFKHTASDDIVKCFDSVQQTDPKLPVCSYPDAGDNADDGDGSTGSLHSLCLRLVRNGFEKSSCHSSRIKLYRNLVCCAMPRVSECEISPTGLAVRPQADSAQLNGEDLAR